jgi:hypothetical protein
MKPNKVILIASFMILAGAAAMAQDPEMKYKTGQRISDQYKNGTVPGLKFGPVTKKVEENVSQPTATERAGTIGSQLKKGGLQGANIAKGGGGSVSRTSTNAKRSSGARQALPSDQAAGSGELKAAPATGSGIKEPAQGGVAQPDLTVHPKTIRKAPVAETKAPAATADPKKKKQ